MSGLYLLFAVKKGRFEAFFALLESGKTKSKKFFLATKSNGDASEFLQKKDCFSPRASPAIDKGVTVAARGHAYIGGKIDLYRTFSVQIFISFTFFPPTRKRGEKGEEIQFSRPPHFSSRDAPLIASESKGLLLLLLLLLLPLLH